MKKLLALSVLAAVASLAPLAHADIQTTYQSSYTFNVNYGPGTQITNILLMEQTADSGSSTWAFSADGNGTTTITNPFPTDSPTTSALLFGIVTDLTTDGSAGQQHLVLFMDNTAAQLSNHIAFGTLFGTSASQNPVTEEDVISDLLLATSGQDWPIITPGLDALGDFANDNAVNGILDPNGNAVSAWITQPSTANDDGSFPEGSFSVVAWTDGAIIGTGVVDTATIITDVPDAPEPASLTLLAAGSLLLLQKRRSTRAAF
jgi:hypothetical protein